MRFADLYAFLFSPRPGTAAAELADALSPVQRQERFDRLLELQAGIGRAVWQQDVGRILPVLVEGRSRQGAGQLFGRTTWNRIVNFQGPGELIGRTVPVRVIRSYKNSQLGELEPASSGSAPWGVDLP